MKKRILNKAIFFILTFVFTNYLAAQEVITSFNADSSTIQMDINIDIQQLIDEDADKEGVSAPLRLAQLFALPVNMQEVGKWTTHNNEDTWTLTIKVPNSYGLIVRYSDFYLPVGAKLYAYSHSRDYEAILYTNSNRANGGRYLTETSWGEEVTLEYVAPSGLTDKPRLQITDIGFKYRDLYHRFPTVSNALRSMRSSKTECIPDINCPEGADWQTQKKGVVRMVTTIGRFDYLCSGSLINNTNKDKTPYVLTATHCFLVNGVTVDPADTDFLFDDELPDCASESPVRPAPKFLSGATPLVFTPINGGSDGALIRLNDNIPTDWDVYFNGWDLTNIGDENVSGAIIQHPLGEVKKIALFTAPPITSTWKEVKPDETVEGASNAHWRVQYTIGASQGGSSGSPLFNQEGLIIGSLTGGSTNCRESSGVDFFGKMWYHWNQYTDVEQHMKKYLDPINSGATKLLGINKEGITPEPPIPPDPEDKADMLVSWMGSDLRVDTKKKVQRVRVVKQSGHEIYSKSKLDFSIITIPASQWQSGIYIITIWVEGGGKHTQKIMK